MVQVYLIGLKEWLVKEKMLSLLCFKKASFPGLLKPFPKQALVFKCLHYRSFENTVGKGEIARKEQFLLSPQCFLPVLRIFCHFCKIQNSRLQTLSVWRSLNIVIWEMP